MDGIRDGAAVAARVEVRARAGDDEVEPDEPARSDRQRRLARSPHRPVGRHDEVGPEPIAVLAQEAGEAGAADLLLALEEEADVERKLAALGQKRLRHQDRDQQAGPCRRWRHARRSARRARSARTAGSPTRPRSRAAGRRSGRTRGSSVCPAGRATHRRRRAGRPSRRPRRRRNGAGRQATPPPVACRPRWTAPG